MRVCSTMVFALLRQWLRGCEPQVLEQFVSKLFALSFSVVNLDVHSSSAADHLVHTMLQR